MTDTANGYGKLWQALTDESRTELEGLAFAKDSAQPSPALVDDLNDVTQRLTALEAGALEGGLSGAVGWTEWTESDDPARGQYVLGPFLEWIREANPQRG